MSETTPKSFWRKRLSGWRGFLLSYALLAGAAFVVVFCFCLLERTNDRIVELILGSLLFALGLALVVVVGGVFLGWLCHWRNLRRFIFGVACLVTLIVLFSTEESWRGRRAWENYRAAAEAKGEKFAFASLAPPPVPDERNFALTPLLQPIYDYVHTTNGVRWRDTNSYARVQRVSANLLKDSWGELHLDGLEKGTLTDLEACRNFYRGNTNYPQPATSGTAAADILVALGKFDAELKELREAAAARPDSRFPIEYDYEPSWAILLPHLGHLRSIGQIVQLRATARLELRQTDEAFDDLKLGFRLADSIRNEPIVIDQIVRELILQSDLQIVREGLVRHAWSDARLAELEKAMSSLNLLADWKSGMRGNRALDVSALDYYRRIGVHGSPTDMIDFSNSGRTPFLMGCLNRMLGGFYYQNMLTIAEMHGQFTLPAVDEKARRVHPEPCRELEKQLDTLRPKRFQHPYKFFAPILLKQNWNNSTIAHTAVNAGAAQSFVDEARVACALERFRLANGRLPEQLTPLVPQYIDAIPNDVIDGQPLRYRLIGDGGYLIYSIGWNQVDDGGKVVFGKGTTSPVDLQQGDWVWQLPGK
jgi:hypothetical protein